jgi:hypothetical protein|tara:strand:- start:1112 stop:1402 length:291 start_codon:yes stop_codon:yes gene_type:complete
MDNQEVLKAIANLADKVSRYHERLLAIERDHIKHVQGCTCQKEVATGKDYPKEGDIYDTLTVDPAPSYVSGGRPLDTEEKAFVEQNMKNYLRAAKN